MDYDLALKVVKNESHELTAHRIVELYNVIEKLTADNIAYNTIKPCTCNCLKSQNRRENDRA